MLNEAASLRFGLRPRDDGGDLAGNVVSKMPTSDLALAVTNSGLDGYITGATVFVDNKSVLDGGREHGAAFFWQEHGEAGSG
jgi:hypothetical protein